MYTFSFWRYQPFSIQNVQGSCEAAMFGKKIQCLFSKYSYVLCIFRHKIFRAFSYIPECYFKIIKSGT